MLNIKVIVSADKVEKNFYRKYVGKPKSAVTKPKVPYSSLSNQQKQIVDDMKLHFAKPAKELVNSQKLVLIQANGGTGKSVTMRHLMFSLANKKKRESNFDYLAIAFSGVSAENIGCSTIHSALRIPSYIEPIGYHRLLDKPITPAFSKFIRNIKVVIVDEHGLVGLRLLNYMNKLFQKCDPANEHLPLAGKSMIFSGDQAQLCPIKDYALGETDFGNASDKELLRSASSIFRQFTTVYRLDQPFRQQETNKLVQMLNRLRTGRLLVDDLKSIRSRMQSNMCEFEQKSFDKAIRVFPYVKQVEEYNTQQLYQRHPNAKFVTVPNGIYGEMLTLCIGARVALGRNISIAWNLVNSSVGNVVDIILQPCGQKIKYVLVKFDHYSGRVLVRSPRGEGIPVLPFRTTEMIRGRLTSYTSIPLSLRYAMTGHKSQSQTFDQIAIMCGEKATPFPGYDYLIFSRTRDLESIMILDESVPDSRFTYPYQRDRDFFRRNALEGMRINALAEQTKN